MIAKEGYFIIAWTVVFVIAAYFLTRDMSLIPRLIIMVLMIDLLALVLFFFRDPDRSLPQGVDPDTVLVAPADGRVVEIKDIPEIPYVGGPGKQLSIFLSILDVHVNRVPGSGVIERATYIPGEYLVAWHPKSSEKNERAEFVLKLKDNTRIVFRQITGLIARRIVYDIDEGSEVTAGSRFGIMKFGSRMDVVVPEGISFAVAKGDRVKAGVTVLARLDEVEHD